MKIGDLCRLKTSFTWSDRSIVIGDLVIVVKETEFYASLKYLDPVYGVLHQRTGEKHHLSRKHLEKIS